MVSKEGFHPVDKKPTTLSAAAASVGSGEELRKLTSKIFQKEIKMAQSLILTIICQ